MDRIKIRGKLVFYYSIFWIMLIFTLYLSYHVYFNHTPTEKSQWLALFAGAISTFASALKILELHFINPKEDINSLSSNITNYFMSGSKIFFTRIIRVVIVLMVLLSFLFLKIFSKKFIVSFDIGIIFTCALYIFSDYIVLKFFPRIFYNKDEKTQFLAQFYALSSIPSLLSFIALLIPTVIIFYMCGDYQILYGYAFGCCLIVLILNICTSISNKAQNLSSQIITNYIAQISKNDKRSPLLLLRGFFKNLKLNMMMPYDGFISCICLLFCAMTIGSICLGSQGLFLPLIICAGGIFSCVIAILITNINKDKLNKNIYISLIIYEIIFLLISYYVVYSWIPYFMGFWVSVATGSLSAIILLFINSSILFIKSQSSIKVSNASISGISNTYLEIIKEGFLSVFVPAILIALSTVISFLAPDGANSADFGFYGVMISYLSSSLIYGLISTVYNFSNIQRQSAALSENYDDDLEKDYKTNRQNNIFSEKFLENELYLNSLGKNYMSYCTIITLIACVITYVFFLTIVNLDIFNPYTIAGVLIGTILPFLFCGFVLKITNSCSKCLTLEVKRQFRKFPQILRYEQSPDYERPIEIATLNSSIKSLFYIFLVVLILYLLLKFLYTEGAAGCLFGMTFSSMGFVFLINSFALISKCAKKYFETQYVTSNDSNELKILSNSAKSFSSFYDLIIPPLNIFVKFMAIFYLAFAVLFQN